MVDIDNNTGHTRKLIVTLGMKKGNWVRLNVITSD